MIRTTGFLTREAALILAGAEIGRAAMPDLSSSLVWGGVIALFLISGAVHLWNYRAERKRREDEEEERRAQSEKIDAILEAQNLKVQKLRAFMNKGHSWSLGEAGRCVVIPDGSRLVEFNDGSYRIGVTVSLKTITQEQAVGRPEVK